MRIIHNKKLKIEADSILKSIFVHTNVVNTYMSIETAIKSIHKMGITTKTVINIMYTSRFIEDAVSNVLKEYDLTSQQYNVLRILRGQNGNPANLCTIQERMIDKSSNTTRLVDKLIKKGWVKRSVCKSNRRKVEIIITEEGLDLLKTLDPLIEQNNENLVSHLTEEQMEAINQYLDKIRIT